MLRRIIRYSVILMLGIQVAASTAQALDGGAFALQPGDSESVTIGSTDRQIHVCVDVKSTGELTVVFADREPVEVSPGGCLWGRSERLTMRNDSTAAVSGIFQIVGKHQS